MSTYKVNYKFSGKFVLMATYKIANRTFEASFFPRTNTLSFSVKGKTYDFYGQVTEDQMSDNLILGKYIAIVDLYSQGWNETIALGVLNAVIPQMYYDLAYDLI